MSVSDELRIAVFDALDNAVANGYRDGVMGISAHDQACELVDLDSDVNSIVFNGYPDCDFEKLDDVLDVIEALVVEWRETKSFYEDMSTLDEDDEIPTLE
jgi:hypothetical protein